MIVPLPKPLANLKPPTRVLCGTMERCAGVLPGMTLVIGVFILWHEDDGLIVMNFPKQRWHCGSLWWQGL